MSIVLLVLTVIVALGLVAIISELKEIRQVMSGIHEILRRWEVKRGDDPISVAMRQHEDY